MVTMDILSEDFDPAKLKVAQLRNLLVDYEIDYKSSATKPVLVEIVRESLGPMSSPYKRAQKEAKQLKAWNRSSDRRQLGKGIVEIGKNGREHVIGVDSSPRSPEHNKNESMSPEPPFSTAKMAQDHHNDKSTRKRSRSRAREPAQIDTDLQPKARKMSTTAKKSARKSTVAPKVESPAESDMSASSPLASRNRHDQRVDLSVPSPARERNRHSEPQQVGMTADRAILRRRTIPSPPNLSEYKAAVPQRAYGKHSPMNGVKVSSPLANRPISELAEDRRRSSLPSKRILSSELSRALSTFGNGSPATQRKIHAGLQIKRSPSSSIGGRAKRRPNPLKMIGKALSLLTMISLLSSAILTSKFYYQESLRLGFCEMDGTSKKGMRRADTHESNLVFWHTEHVSVPILQYLSIEPRCTPCPQQAICQDGQFISCRENFIRTTNPYLSYFSNLWPFVSRCQPDVKRLSRIMSLSNGIAKSLSVYRGDVMCGKYKAKRQRGMSESAKFGRDLESIREELSSSPLRSSMQVQAIWEPALHELLSRSDIASERNSRNETFVYSTKAEIGLACRLRLFAWAKLVIWWPWLLLPCLTVLLGLWGVKRNRYQANIRRKVLAVVGDVLVMLKEQEQSHYIDPVYIPYPYLSVTQLRDRILSDVHSAKERTAIWSGVEDIVEANSNVRVSEAEMRGNIWRAWQWIGGAERLTEDTASPRREETLYPKLPEMSQRS